MPPYVFERGFGRDLTGFTQLPWEIMSCRVRREMVWRLPSDDALMWAGYWRRPHRYFEKSEGVILAAVGAVVVWFLEIALFHFSEKR